MEIPGSSVELPSYQQGLSLEIFDPIASYSSTFHSANTPSPIHSNKSNKHQCVPVPDEDFYAALITIEHTFENIRRSKKESLKSSLKLKLSNDGSEESIINKKRKRNKLLRELESSILLQLEGLIRPIPSYEYAVKFIQFPTPMRELIYSRCPKEEKIGSSGEDVEEELLLDREAMIRARELRPKVRESVKLNVKMMECQFQRLVALTVKEHTLSYPISHHQENSISYRPVDDVENNCSEKCKRIMELEINDMHNSLQIFQKNIKGIESTLLEKINLLKDTITVIENSLVKKENNQKIKKEITHVFTENNYDNAKEKQRHFSKTELIIISRDNERNDAIKSSMFLEHGCRYRKKTPLMLNPDFFFSTFMSR